MEDNEILVTLRDVLLAVILFVLVVSGICSLFALIWFAWGFFHWSATVFVVACFSLVLGLVFPRKEDGK